MDLELQKIDQSMISFMKKDLSLVELVRSIDKNRIELNKRFDEDKTYGFDLPLTDYLEVVKRMLSSQKYGPRIQNKVADIMGYESIHAKNKKGDFLTPSNKFLEFKVSYYYKGSYSFLQIRPWDKFGHIFLIIYPDYSYTIFFLTPEQIKYELEKIGEVCHGNTDLKSIRLYPHSKKNAHHFERWIKNYKMDDFSDLIGIIK